MSGDSDRVILVDAADRETGVADKLQAHREGLRHRAISVLIVDGAGRMLLQRRAMGKYHSGGLWTNACCSHPRPGEASLAAAVRRLREEMGFSCPLHPLFVTSYRAAVGDLIEDEVVHVFGGVYIGPVAPDPAEVEAIEWRDIAGLVADIATQPQRYSVWFAKYLAEFHAEIGAISQDATTRAGA